MLIEATTRVALGSLTAAHHNFLSVRCVPFAASPHAHFSVSFGENRRPDSVNQRPSCAQLRHLCPSSTSSAAGTLADCLRGVMQHSHVITGYTTRNSSKTTGIRRLDSLPIRLHSRPKCNQCISRQYFRVLSPSPSPAAKRSVTVAQNAFTSGGFRP